MSFQEIIEEIHTLDYNDKLELKTLLEKYLIEGRRKEILNRHNDAVKMADKGELVFSDNIHDLLNN